MAEYGVANVAFPPLRGEAQALERVTESYEGVKAILAQRGEALGPMRVIRSGCCHRCASLGWVAETPDKKE